MQRLLNPTDLEQATALELTIGQEGPALDTSVIQPLSLQRGAPVLFEVETGLNGESNVDDHLNEEPGDDDRLNPCLGADSDLGLEEAEEIAPELYSACSHPAGSTARIDTLIRRLEERLPLWHPNDRHDYSGITGAVRQDKRLKAARREVIGKRDAYYKALEEADHVEIKTKALAEMLTKTKALGGMLQQHIDDDGLVEDFEQEMSELLRERGLPKYNRRDAAGRNESDSLALAGVVVVAGMGYKNPNSDFEGINEARERAYQNALAAVEQKRRRQQGGASERKSVSDEFQSTPAPSKIAESSPEIPQKRPIVSAELPPGFGANTPAEEVSRLFADITPAQELLQSLQFYAEAVVKGTLDRDSYHGFVEENLAELQRFLKRRSINLASESQVVLREDTPALVVASMLNGREISDPRLKMLKLYAIAVVQGTLTQSEYKSFLAENPGILDSLVAAHSDGGLAITQLAASA